MRVAAIQTRSGVSIEENCTRVEKQIRAAAREGARYIQTPEMTGILQRSRVDLFSQIRPSDEDLLVSLAKELSKELDIWLHIGSQAIKLSDTKAANRGFLISPTGEIAAHYDKIHMFDVDLDNGESWRESNAYEAGDVGRVVSIDGILTGLSICYDMRFPDLYRQQALAGAQLLTAPSSFTKQTGIAHWHILLRARAIENGAFMIAAAQGGKHEDGRETYGHTLIVSPWGEIIAECDHDEPGFVVADIDIKQVAKARGRIPNLANTRDFMLETQPEFSSAVSNEAAE